MEKAPRIRRLEMVVNPASGGVGVDAVQAATDLLAELGVEGRVTIPEGGDVPGALRAAIQAKPDAVIVLAGDGTARLAAAMAGPHGVLLAPLPGGTMNMLPHALYGKRDWKSALRDSLADPAVRRVGGGEINGEAFYVAAILGSPALFAEAREAAREGHLGLALQRTRRALRRMLTGPLRFSLEGGLRGKAEAVSLICPLISTAVADDERALEAAVLDVRSALDIFHLAYTAAVRDWRDDPAVSVGLCRHGEVRAAGRIPAILDGEPMRFKHKAVVRYRPVAFRALVPASEAGADS